MDPIKKDMAFVLADRWVRVDANAFGPELIIHKGSGDFAIDDFQGFLDHIKQTVDQSLVLQVIDENIYRQKQGDPAMTRAETIELLEQTVVRNKNSIVSLDPFTPVFTGYWRLQNPPRVYAKLVESRKKVTYDVSRIGRGLVTPIFYNHS